MDGFKQRIVGAVIIVSLAVIFVPMLFDEPHEERERQDLDIPEEPDFPEVRMDEPQEPEMSEPEEAVEPPTADVDPPEEPAESEPEPAPEPNEAAQEPEPEPEPEMEPEPFDEDEVAAFEEQQQEPDTGAPDSSELEGSYLVQLGSFGSAENARALRDRVREEGMEAYTESVSRDDETLNRVYAGPFLDKADAESAKERLDEVFELQTMVISGGD